MQPCSLTISFDFLVPSSIQVNTEGRAVQPMRVPA